MLRAHRRMKPSRASATKALIYLAVYSLLIAGGVEAFDCISITGFNLQCISLDANNSAISQCLVPPPNVSAYELLCDENRDCPVDIDEGDMGNRGGESFNPTLICSELINVHNHQVYYYRFIVLEN